MNEELIKRWNSVVGVNDIVIHLGDFAWRGKANLIRPKLNGTIILIRGNHDLSVNENNGFIIVEGNLIINNMVFSHHPIPLEELPLEMINIFGHIHHQDVFDSKRQKNVSVEKTDYTPINLKELQDEYLLGYK
jgi:calcineurin-like phosphoesterase family protein